MCKFDPRLLVLISFMSVALHAADNIIEGLETAGKVIQAAKPVVAGASAIIKDGVDLVSDGIEKVPKPGKIGKSERISRLEEALPNYVSKKDFDASQQTQEDEIGRLRASIPNEKHPHNFVQNNPNDPLVTESRLKTVTAPLQKDVQDLQNQMNSRVTQQQLADATAGVVKSDPNNPVVAENRLQIYVQDQLNGAQENQKVVRQYQMENYVQGQLNGVVKQNDLNGYLTKDDMRNWMKGAAGQCALGFSSYRLSWMMQSLLKSAGMQNSYVDLKDVSVPMTTFMASFAARAGKEMYQTQGIADAQKLAQKSLVDTVASAIVIALKNIFCDEQMRDYYDKNWSENQKAGAYAVAVLPVSLIVNMLAQDQNLI